METGQSDKEKQAELWAVRVLLAGPGPGYRQVKRQETRLDDAGRMGRLLSFFFLWGGKKSLKLSGETRIDETKRTKATAAPGAALAGRKKGKHFPSACQRPDGTNSLIHSLTHTTNTTLHSLPGVPSPGSKRYRRPGGREGALESTPQCTHPPPPCTALKTTAARTVTAELCVCVVCSHRGSL